MVLPQVAESQSAESPRSSEYPPAHNHTLEVLSQWQSLRHTVTRLNSDPPHSAGGERE